MLLDQSAAELTGWTEYLKLDDELKVSHLVGAIRMAFKKEDE